MAHTTLCNSMSLSTTLWFQDNSADNNAKFIPSIVERGYHTICRITS